jgi:hypothetical protein
LKKESQPAFMLNPKEISGDVGEDQNTGGGRRIVWEILKEFPAGLEGDDYYFKVDAEMMKKSSGIWWWIAGGAAVAGGTAAILLKSSPASGPTVNNVFPQPPPRP